MSMNLEFGDYRCQRTIGKGSFSTVYEAYHKTTNQKVAVKAFNHSFVSNIEIKTKFELEAEILYTFKANTNILCIYSHGFKEDTPYLVLEYCQYGNLEDFIQKNFQSNKIPEYMAQKLLNQILSGLLGLAQSNIVHRDLKLENILVGEGHTIKISDFSESKIAEGPNQVLSTMKGTPLTIAPEVFSEKYTSKADIWSLGIILYRILTGVYPYPEIANKKGIIQQSKYILEQISKPDWPNLPDDLSKPVKDLLVNMLFVDPNQRASIKELSKNDWLLGTTLNPQIKIESEDRLVHLNGFRFWFPDTSFNFKHRYYDLVSSKTEPSKYVMLNMESFAGSDSSFKIFLGCDSKSKKSVAIRVTKCESDEAAYEKFLDKQPRLLSKIDHPNIVKLLETEKGSDGLYYQIFEYCGNSTLDIFLTKNFPLTKKNTTRVPEHQLQKIMQQIFSGVFAIDQAKLIHTSISLQKILVDEDYTLKIAGFSHALEKEDEELKSDQEPLSNSITKNEPSKSYLQTILGIFSPAKSSSTEMQKSFQESESKSFRGSFAGEIKYSKTTRISIAPEVVKGNKFSEKSVVWALGAVLYEIITGNVPNPSSLELPLDISNTVKELTLGMLQVDEEKRMSLSQLAKHPWLTGSFTYQRIRVTMEKISFEIETENFDAKIWYPQTEEYFQKQYGLIMEYLNNKKEKKI